MHTAMDRGSAWPLERIRLESSRRERGASRSRIVYACKAATSSSVVYECIYSCHVGELQLVSGMRAAKREAIAIERRAWIRTDDCAWHRNAKN